MVLYNSVLSRMFKANVNVEYCNSVKAIKYICKYVYKGSDQVMFGLQKYGVNKVDQYQLGRYISSNEDIWKILNFPIHERFLAVMHLSVHPENGKRVYFPENMFHDKIENPPRPSL